MKRNNVIILILFVVLGVLLLVYFMYSGNDEKRYQWNESYHTTSDQPYGTLFIKELLKSYRPGEDFIVNETRSLSEVLDSTTQNTDYVFIGENIYLDEADNEALLTFISAGNDAFVSTVNLPFDLIDPIFQEECAQKLFLEQHEALSVLLNFYHPSLAVKKGYSYAYRDGKKDVKHAWSFITNPVFCDSTTSIIPLGYIQPDRVNFVKFPHGKGNLYVHCNPLVFTNYFLTKPDKAAYAAAVFSHLNGKSIIWDDFSKSNFTGNKQEQETNPLAYILQHNSLKYAWWMMLGCVILYTLFTAKRKQRAIPVLEKKVNTSLEFVKMISVLHFQNANHTDIAQKKMKYFQYYIRDKYGIHAQHFTEHHLKRLSEKSKIDLKHIQYIFDEFNQIERSRFTNDVDKLMNLYNALDNFYKHCK